MANSTDHMTGQAGLSPTVSLSKNGGDFTEAAGAVTEVGYGWYALAGNATDRSTLGTLIVHAEAVGADPFDMDLAIIASDPPTKAEIDTQLSTSHGSGIWGPSVGLTPKTYTLRDGGGVPVPGIECWVTSDEAGLSRIDIPRVTNDLGQITFQLNLPTGTHVWVWHRNLTEGDEEVM